MMMMMMRKASVLVGGFFLLLLCMADDQSAHAGAAVVCNPMELNACAGAILNSAPPSPECCAKLKQQQSCFCQYSQNPVLRGYITSGNGRKVATACKVPLPRC